MQRKRDQRAPRDGGAVGPAADLPEARSRWPPRRTVGRWELRSSIDVGCPGRSTTMHTIPNSRLARTRFKHPSHGPADNATCERALAVTNLAERALLTATAAARQDLVTLRPTGTACATLASSFRTLEAAGLRDPRPLREARCARRLTGPSPCPGCPVRIWTRSTPLAVGTAVGTA